MDPKKSNKIRDIVRLQQILKKWKKLANAPKPPPSINNSNKLGIKFLKRTLSLTDMAMAMGGGAAAANSEAVPKGYLAVCVGKELKRFIIPTEYLGHRAFAVLLREAEEEFGFQQEGVLQIPCEVSVFERILKKVQCCKEEEDEDEDEDDGQSVENDQVLGCCSPESDLTRSHHPQMCR